MSSPIDCSSPVASPTRSSSTSSTLSDGQSSATLANDPVAPDDGVAPFGDSFAGGGEDGPVGERREAPGVELVDGYLFAYQGREPRRHVPTTLSGLLFVVIALLPVLYAVRYTFVDTSSDCGTPARSWLAPFQPEPVRKNVTLDIAGELEGIVEAYEPFLGGEVALLPLHAHPAGYAKNPIGASHAFFDDMSRAVTGLCASIKQSRTDAVVDESLLGHVGRRHEEGTERLCRPLVDLVSSTSTAYLEIVHALAGPRPEALWLRQVAARLSMMAEQVQLIQSATDFGHGRRAGDAMDEVDYVAANDSAADVFQAYTRAGGMWPRLNSRFIGTLSELRSNCAALREAVAALSPVTHSFIVGMSASPASLASLPAPADSPPGDLGETLLLQAQVVDNWLNIESALPVLEALAAAAEEGIGALVMANYQIQMLYDRLGRLRASCWVLRESGSGRGVAVHVALADPRSLRDAVVRVSKWLEMQIVGT